MKTCVVIPTFNESRTIADLIKKIRQQDLPAVVVDDGSGDNTAQIAADSGATVLRNPDNLGKGASLIRGFDYALGKDFDAIITMDGDGQHLAEEIPFFLRLAKYSDTGIFVGNRMSKPKSMPWIRLATNKFMSWLLSKIIGQKISDTQCGFRLIKKEALKNITLASAKFEIESEMLVKAARKGFKIESVPIKTVYGEEKSQINPIVDTLRFIKFIVRELWTGQP